ncbi:MAG TPA: hypothetical protein VNO75_02865 [Gemmatimonadaceae bacterium]|nr:hypothetical protein [Gemmatimonadaceae bacterium]
MSENDWSTQLKKIEREFEGLPPDPSPAVMRMQSESERLNQQRAEERSASLGAAARLFLVLALGAAISLWPYAHECGVGLLTYIGVELMLIVGGVWVATYSWRHRLPRIHILSLVVALGGLVLVAMEVLPRTGYAAVDPQNLPQVSCVRA